MENKKYLHILVDSCDYLTQYKFYEVEEENQNCYIITDDEGDRIWLEQTGYDVHTDSREGFKVYEKYTKVRTFDSDCPYEFPQNGKVYDAEIVNHEREVVCYRAGEDKYFILLNRQCAFLNKGGKWEILGNDYKEEESEPVNTVSVDSTEYKIQVMQAWLDGESIQISSLQERVWKDWSDWGVPVQPNWNWEENSYRIKPKEELKLSIDWDQVADGYDYLAMDSDGDVYLYTHSPIRGDESWIYKDGDMCKAEPFSSLVIPSGINWKESLVERPK